MECKKAEKENAHENGASSSEYVHITKSSYLLGTLCEGVYDIIC